MHINADAPGELIDLMLSEVIAGHMLREDTKFFGLFAEPVDGEGGEEERLTVTD